jgi:lipoate---protein ligase
LTGKPSPWRVERCTAGAAELLEPWPPTDGQDVPAVRAGRLSGRTTVVLGSTQTKDVIDAGRAARAGVDVVRRSTGGGAVLVAPASQVWLDVWVPRGHGLWDDDIIGAAAWLGDAWMRALASLGAEALRVHDGAAVRGAVADLVCFAGLGPGEGQVATDTDTDTDTDTATDTDTDTATRRHAGAKVTGLAQRRTRTGARFHTTAPLVWEPGPLSDLLAGGGVEDVTSLETAAVGLRALVPVWGRGVSDGDVIDTVEKAVIAALP